MNVIVVAVLALAVMIVLIIMLVTKTSVIGKSDLCENQNGKCVAEGTDCPDGFTKWTIKKCGTSTDEKPLDCCFPTGG